MNIFIAFANQDLVVRDKLLRQLNLVRERQGWKIWSAKEIKAGEYWDDEIKRRLLDSQVVVLLLSTDFFNSTYIIEKELPEVVRMHQAGTCQIIPVIVRKCHWKDTAFGAYAELGDLQALPVGEKPILSKAHWDHEDDPYFDIVEGIKDSIQAFQAKQSEGVTFRHPLTPVQAKEAESSEEVTKSHRLTSTLAFDYPMVRVEGGTFQMGSPKTDAGRYDDECQHTVTVASFSIGQYEVTQANWREIMGNNPSHFRDNDNCPVEQVSWNDVQDFLIKLNAKYPGNNYRLPTEAEWEYAARGGNKSRGYQYAGSDDLGSVAWYKANAGDKTHPVGTRNPNELGLYDMSGNVLEWCQDTFKPYPGCAGTSNSNRIFRGGGWVHVPRGCRPASRGYSGPDYRLNYLGFRLALQ